MATRAGLFVAVSDDRLMARVLVMIMTTAAAEIIKRRRLHPDMASSSKSKLLSRVAKKLSCSQASRVLTVNLIWLSRIYRGSSEGFGRRASRGAPALAFQPMPTYLRAACAA